ncbi:MAG: efflux RND transporter permease subunit, partial [Armatimonadetes bacterium]|nr:efflux RND transporter permease subunit [Armatimonadota bacterium]
AFVSGGDVREVQIQIKKDQLLAYGIGINDVTAAINAASLNVPSGRVVNGDQELSVRVQGEFKTVSEMREMQIRVNDPNSQKGDGQIVRLGDIAEVKDTVEERRGWSRLNGKDAVVMSILKIKEGNAVEISDAAQKLAAQLQTTYPIKFEVTFNNANTIKESILDVQIALYFGIALVVAIVFIFLHDWRGTLIVAIAIPVCLAATLIAMNALGFTINNMSMLALTLAIGVLVDDAIVVLENIYRHLKMGEDPYTAAINGRGEIGLAAIAITLADVVVFIPVGFMGGIVGQFFRQLGIGFAVCVLLSLFVSFTITPLLAARWYKAGEDIEHNTGRFGRWFDRGFARFERAYGRALEWALNHRWFVFCLGFTILITLFMFIGGGFAPDYKAAMMTALAGPIPMVFVLAIVAAILSQISNGKLPMYNWVGGAIAGLLTAIISPLLLTSVLGSIGPIVFFIGVIVAAIVIGRKLIRSEGTDIQERNFKIGWLAAAAGFAVLPIMMLMPILGLTILGLTATLMLKRAYPYRNWGGAAFFSGIILLGALGGHWYASEYKKGAIFKFEFAPNTDQGKINAVLELPAGTNLQETEKAVAGIEQVVLKNPNVKYAIGRVGSKGGGGFNASDVGTNYGSVEITLHEKSAMLDKIMFWKKHEGYQRSRADSSIAADLLEAYSRRPGQIVTFATQSGFGFGAAIQMSFSGDDRDALLATANKIKSGLETGVIEGVISPSISAKPGKPEIRAIPNRTRLADYGLSTAEVANTMRVMYEGNDDSRFRVLGKEYKIRVMMDTNDRNNPDIVSQLPIKFKNGSPIYVSDVATLEPGRSVEKIERRNRAEEIRVEANLLPGYAAGSVQAKINEWLVKDKIVPDGVKKIELGQADAQNRETGYLLGALGLGFILVYMLLAALFNNVLYPFIIQLAQPQALVGALLALVLTDKAMNIVSFIGIITLVGLVGKNAILLVDYTNTLRSRGKNRHDALVEAGPTRLRPIMMTSIAVVLGMLPVALAIGRGSEFRETLGITIIGGITLSTLLTLLIIPCSYTIFDDLSNLIGRRKNAPAADPNMDIINREVISEEKV